MITAVTSVGRAVIKPRPDNWGDECRTSPAGALSRRTESLRPLATLDAWSAAAMWRGHRQLSGGVPVAAPARCVPSGGSGC
jgi:hypothetical protein